MYSRKLSYVFVGGWFSKYDFEKSVAPLCLLTLNDDDFNFVMAWPCYTISWYVTLELPETIFPNLFWISFTKMMKRNINFVVWKDSILCSSNIWRKSRKINKLSVLEEIFNFWTHCPNVWICSWPEFWHDPFLSRR